MYDPSDSIGSDMTAAQAAANLAAYNNAAQLDMPVYSDENQYIGDTAWTLSWDGKSEDSADSNGGIDAGDVVIPIVAGTSLTATATWGSTFAAGTATTGAATATSASAVGATVATGLAWALPIGIGIYIAYEAITCPVQNIPPEVAMNMGHNTMPMTNLVSEDILVVDNTLLFKEHTKGARPSTKDKHTKPKPGRPTEKKKSPDKGWKPNK